MTTGRTTTRQPAAARRRAREREILQATRELFDESGVRDAQIEDIARAVGVNRAIIYRHFSGKEDILLAAVDAWTEHRFEEIEEILATSTSPYETLERLARDHARATVDQPSLTAVILAERRMLAPEARASIERVIRLRTQEWVHALCQVRPELSEAESRLMVFSVFTLLASVTQYDSGLDPDLVEELLVDMAMKSLLLPRA